MNGHEKIYKNRFLVWVMFALPILCTGWFSLMVWTLVQLYLLDKDIIEYDAYKERERKEWEERMKRKKTANTRYLKKEIQEFNLNLPQALATERDRRNKELGGNWVVTKKGEWIDIAQYDYVCYF